MTSTVIIICHILSLLAVGLLGYEVARLEYKAKLKEQRRREITNIFTAICNSKYGFADVASAYSEIKLNLNQYEPNRDMF